MNKIALVTGAAGGIGNCTAKMLAAEGYTVAAMDVLPPQAAADRFDGTDIFYVSGDLSLSSDRKAVVDAVVAKFGRIDLLVNVAGVAPTVRSDLLTMTEESYDRVMNINTRGTLFLTQLVANQMLSQPAGSTRGIIVNIASMSSYTSSVNRGEYCISKAGVSMITTLFADRLAGEGILVYEVRPGIIATAMTSKVQGKYDALIDGGLLPIKRWGTPDDVANAVCVLCSGRLSYSTGEVINVDGGFHIRRL